MSDRDSPDADGPQDPLFQGDEEFEEEDFGAEDIEASLNDALSDLERMLERRGDGDEGEQRSPDHGSRDDETYRIPLLDEVVIPGPGITEIQHEQAPLPAAEHAAMDESASRRRLATRLASEIEVIVQDRLEHAINKACEEIREQVRNHMDIILPEIVEEMLQHRHRNDD